MKVLTWNCNLLFRKDFDLIRHFDSDIIVIQECEKLETDQFKGYKSYWIGLSDSKGLAVLTKGKSTFASELFRSDLVYFLPVSFGDTAVLGVWAFNRRAKKKLNAVSGFPIDAINHYNDWLKSHKNIVVAGDFNNGPRWDKPGSKNNFHTFSNALSELGLQSSYHHFTGESPGQETKSTHFHQRNPVKGFHIDYIFTNYEKVDSVLVGNLEHWNSVSDHVPLVSEFKN
jgi:exodeoxyribonuclease-3